MDVGVGGVFGHCVWGLGRYERGVWGGGGEWDLLGETNLWVAWLGDGVYVCV